MEISQSNKPENRKDTISTNEYVKLSEHASNQIDRTWDAYRRLGTLITILFAVGLGIGTFLLFDTRQGINDELDIVKERVENRIDEEFRKENIAKLVETKAVERIDKVADEIIEKRITEKTVPIVNSVDNIKDNIENFKEDFNKKAEVLPALLLVAKAQSDDRGAYEELKKSESSSNLEIAELAKTTISKITESYQSVGFYLAGSVTIGTKPGIEADVEELINGLSHSDPRIRKGIMDTLYEKDDKSAIPQIIERLRKDDSLAVCAAAFRTLNKLTEQKIQPFDFESWYSWWEKNKVDFKD